MTLNNQNTDFDALETIAAAAIETLTASNRPDAKRWQNAIRKAVTELQENPFWSFDGQELVMMSTTSNQTYTPNGKCGCVSYVKHNQPCRHRAAARIIQRYAEQA